MIIICQSLSIKIFNYRIVAYNKTKELIMQDTAKAFRFDEFMGVDEELMLKVSDHYPVEVDLIPSGV